MVCFYLKGDFCFHNLTYLRQVVEPIDSFFVSQLHKLQESNHQVKRDHYFGAVTEVVQQVQAFVNPEDLFGHNVDHCLFIFGFIKFRLLFKFQFFHVSLNILIGDFGNLNELLALFKDLGSFHTYESNIFDLIKHHENVFDHFL